jgi:hypothetical protein
LFNHNLRWIAGDWSHLHGVSPLPCWVVLQAATRMSRLLLREKILNALLSPRYPEQPQCCAPNDLHAHLRRGHVALSRARPECLPRSNTCRGCRLASPIVAQPQYTVSMTAREKQATPGQGGSGLFTGLARRYNSP